MSGACLRLRLGAKELVRCEACAKTCQGRISPLGASAQRRKSRYETHWDPGCGSRPTDMQPSLRAQQGTGVRGAGVAFRSGRGVYVGGGKRCQTPRCHAGGTSLPMQLIREDVSEEVAFALGLKVGLGQRAGKRARRREPGNLGMDGSSLAVGGELAAPLFLIVEGPESLPLAFEL